MASEFYPSIYLVNSLVRSFISLKYVCQVRATSRLPVLFTLVLLVCALTTNVQATPPLSGPGSASQPITPPLNPNGETDITQYLVADQYLNLPDARYVVRIPDDGSLPSAKNADYALTKHFVSEGTPTIRYTAVMTGTGTIRVTTTTPYATNPKGVYGYTSINGGCLSFKFFQPFVAKNLSQYVDGGNRYQFVPGQPDLATFIVDPNVALGYTWISSCPVNRTVAAGAPPSANPGGQVGSPYNFSNIVNNGIIVGLAAAGSGWGSITGSGIIVLENVGGTSNTLDQPGIFDQPPGTFSGGDNRLEGARYSAYACVGSGAWTSSRSQYDAKMSFVATFIWNYEFGGLIPGDIYEFGNDSFYNVTVTGRFLRGGPSPSPIDLMPGNLSQQWNYVYGVSMGWAGARVMYMRNNTYFGNGQAVVDYGDDSTNFFLQANEYTNMMQFGHFQSRPYVPADANRYQNLYFNYSGTYAFNGCVNLYMGGDSQLAGPRNFDVYGANFTVQNPGAGKRPNYAVVTQPMFYQGVTTIENNAVLQLGDGTVGNDISRPVVFKGGNQPNARYSSSNGNGMVLTKSNSSAVYRWPVADQIRNSGKLIINNTPNAQAILKAVPELAALLNANLLDDIVGTGSVEQRGQLPLTLGDTSYTGETLIGPDSTLYLLKNPTFSLPGGDVPRVTAVYGTIQFSSGIFLRAAGAVFDISKGGDQLIQDLIGDVGADANGWGPSSGARVSLGGNALTLGSDRSSQYDGVIADGGAQGGVGGRFVKQGAGTLTLTGTNTYTGGTTINQGTLALGSISALGTGSVNNQGGTLTTAINLSRKAPTTTTEQLVQGIFRAPVYTTTYTSSTVSSTFRAPRINDNYTQGAGGTLLLRLDATGMDMLTVTGTANLAGVLQVNVADDTPAGTYTVIQAGTLNAGSLIKITNSGRVTFNTATAGVIKVVVAATAPALMTPTAPTLTSATAGSGKVGLAWTPPSGVVTDYRVYRSTAGGAFTEVATVQMASWVDATVIDGTAYTYRVTALNKTVESTPSNSLDAAPQGVASSPGGLIAVAGDGQVTLTWNELKNSIFTQYAVLRAKIGEPFAQIATVDKATFTHNDSQVSNGITYQYAVVTLNQNVASPVTYRVTCTPASAPTAPLSVTATAVDFTQSVQISWAASASNNASSYQVLRSTSADSGFVEVAPAVLPVIPRVTFVDSNAINGLTYFYRIIPYNNTVPGAAAQISVVAPPGGPFLISTQPVGNGITLNWTTPSGVYSNFTILRGDAPASTNADPAVDSGVITYAILPAGANVQGNVAPDSAATFTDLATVQGKRYYYKIYANLNALKGPLGIGYVLYDGRFEKPRPKDFMCGTDQAPPGQPQLVSAVPNASSVALTWTAPNSGAPVSKYVVKRASAPAGPYDIVSYDAWYIANDKRSYTDYTVKGQKTYYYKIAAYSGSVGQAAWTSDPKLLFNETTFGPDSNMLAATTVVADAPGTPTLNSVAATLPLADQATTTIALGWSPPPAISAGNITGYEVYRSTSSDTGYNRVVALTGAITTYVDTVTIASPRYYYRVAAVNGSSLGAYSNERSVITAPGPAQQFSVTANDGYAELRWFVPNVQRAGNFNRFVVRRTNGTTTVEIPLIQYVTPTYTIANPATGFTYYFKDSSITNGTTYTYTVLARNDSVDSLPANAVTVSPHLTPVAVGEVSGLGINGVAVINLSWTPPANRSSYTGTATYRLERSAPNNNNGFAVLSGGLTTTSFSDTAVVMGATYYYRITPLDGGLAGPGVTSPGIQSAPNPPALVTMTGVNNQTALQVNWQAPLSGSWSNFTLQLFDSLTATTPVFTAPAIGWDRTGYTITAGGFPGLKNGATYYATIFSTYGPLQSTVPARVSANTQPDAVTNFKGTPGNNQVRFTWTPPATGNYTSFTLYRALRTGNVTSAFTAVAEGIAGSSYTDTGLTNAQTYIYYLVPLNGTVYGPGTSQFWVQPNTVPPAITTLVATPAAGAITLNWTAPNGFLTMTPGALRFNIAFSLTPGGPYTPYSWFINTSPTTTGYSSRLTGLPDNSPLENGKTYYWVVYAFKSAVSGEASNEAAAAANPAPAAPADLVAQAFNGGVQLGWSAPPTSVTSGTTTTVMPPATGYRILRSTTWNSGFSVIATLGNVTTYTDTSTANSTASAATPYYYQVVALNGDVPGPASVTDAAMPPGVNAPWLNTDVGVVGIPGSAQQAGGVFASVASGSDIWGGADQFQYVYQPVTATSGDCTIVARVVSTSPNISSKAGVMIRESLQTSARYVTLFEAFNGSATAASANTSFQARTVASGTQSSWANGAGGYPYWVKLVRRSNVFTAYSSADGANWAQLGSPQTISDFAVNSYVGLINNARNNGTTNTVFFDNVSVQQGDIPAAMGVVTAQGQLGASNAQQVRLNWSAVTAASSYTITRAPVSGGMFAPIATVTDLFYVDTGLTAGTPYFYKVVPVGLGGEGTASVQVIGIPPGVPAPWLSLNIGQFSTLGNASQIAAGAFILAGDGTGALNRHDEGVHVVEQSVIGNATIIARVVSQSISQPVGGTLTAQNAKAGIMIRESNMEMARSVSLVAAPSNQFQIIPRRDYQSTQPEVITANTVAALPYWLKLTREGNQFTSYVSATGVTWTQVDQRILPNGSFSSVAYIGLVSTGGSRGVVQVAQFDNVTVTSTTVPSTAPVLATPQTAPGQVMLSWSAVPGAASYIVQQSSNAGVSFATIATVTDTTATAAGLTSGATYHYRVAAANSAGTGVFSNVVSAIPPAPLATPTLALVSITPTQVNLSWNTVSGATSYTLRRSGAAGGVSTPIVTGLTGTSTSDLNAVVNPLRPGATYYYELVAVGAATSSAVSNRVTALLPPTAPSALAASTASGSGQIKLSWVPPAGATVTTYRVERSSSPGSGFAALAAGTGLTTTAFTDTTSALGTTYYYRVLALSGAATSTASNVASATTAPNPVATISAVSAINAASQSSVTVTWSAPTGVVGNYTLARGTVSGGPYAAILGNGLAVRTFTDTGVTNNQTYYYTVVANNGSLVSVGNAQARVFTAPVPVLALNATGVDGIARVNLSWTAVTGATSYTVQRSTSAAAGFATVTNGTGLTSTAFADTTVSLGQTYYYRILALNNSVAGNPSPVASVVTAPSAASSLVATNAAGGVNLTWSAPGGQVTGYTVRRGTTSGGPYATILSSGQTGTQYSDASTIAGARYFYVVTSLHGPVAGLNSNQAAASVAPNSPRLPSATGVYAVNRADVTWLAPTAGQFTSFTVQRSTSAGGPFIGLAAGTNLVFPGIGANSGTRMTFSDATTTNAQTYYYQIVANSDGGSSAPSNVVQATVAPAQVTGLKATANDGAPSVTLSWDALPADRFSGYLIRRAISNGTNTPETASYVFMRPNNSSNYTAATYTDNTVDKGITYFYKVYVYYPIATGGTIDGADSAPATVSTAPAMVGNFTATVPNGPAASVTLSWTAPATGTFTGFTVQRSTGGNTFTTLATALPANILTYIDPALSLNSAYTYRVFARNGLVTGIFAQITANTASTPPLNLKATQVAGQNFVSLSWDPAGAATYTYIIQRATSQAGTYTTIQSGLRNTTAIDTITGTSTYWYQVMAVVGSASSAPSNKAATTAIPAAVTNLAATPSASGQIKVALTWGLPVGTYGNMVVQRSLSQTQNYSDLVTLAATATTHVDTTTAGGATYYYKVMAKGPNGLAADSNIVSALTIPNEPLKLTAGYVNGTGRAQLSWQAPGGKVDRYTLRRGTVPGDYATIVNSDINSSSPVVYYTDNGVSAGTTYYYVVSARNITGSSANSNEAATVNIPSAPAQLKARGASAAADLQWVGVSGSTGYNVQRSTSFDGPFVRIGSVAGGVTSYHDVTVQNQSGAAPIVYYYTVTAASGAVESFGSNRAAALPPGMSGPWTVSQDIPLYPGFIPGAANLVNGTLTVVASGNDISGTGDTFHYTAQPVDTSLGRFNLITRIASVRRADNASKVGLMIRESLEVNSRSFAVYASPGEGKIRAATRLTTGASTSTEEVSSGNTWLRLTGVSVGAGDQRQTVVTAYSSAEGVDWAQLGAPQSFPALPATVYLGFGVSAHNSKSTATAVFDQIANYTGNLLPAPTNFIVTPASTQANLNWNAVAGASRYVLRRSTTPAGTYTAVAANITGTSYTDTGLIDGNDYFYTVAPFSLASGEGTSSIIASVIPAGLPAPWKNQDIGAINTFTIGGASGISGNRLLVAGEGTGIGGSADSFQFAYQPLTGDGAIQVRVLSHSLATADAKAGLMIRESLASDARFISTFHTVGQGMQSLYRATTDVGGVSNPANNTGPSPALPYWVRLSRSGNIFTSATAPDNSGVPGTWVTLNTQTFTMDATASVGIAVTGGGAGAYNLAGVDQFGITPTAPVLSTPVVTGNQVGLNWISVNGATGYTLKRATVNGGPYADIAINQPAIGYTDSGGLNMGTTYYYVATANNSTGSSGHSAQVSAVASGTPYQQWKVANGLALTIADSATPDNDGIPVLLKYATATPVNVAATNPVTVGSAGGKLTLTFRRLVPATVEYRVEASNDLVNWTAISTLSIGATSWTGVDPVNETGADATRTVTVTDNVLQAAQPQRFLRLRVSTVNTP